MSSELLPTTGIPGEISAAIAEVKSKIKRLAEAALEGR